MSENEDDLRRIISVRVTKKEDLEELIALIQDFIQRKNNEGDSAELMREDIDPTWIEELCVKIEQGRGPITWR